MRLVHGLPWGTSRFWRGAVSIVNISSVVAVAAAVLAGCSSTALLHAVRQHTLELYAPNTVILIIHSPRDLGVRDVDLERWVWDVAASVRTYYGRFPVKRLHVDVEPINGLGPQNGAASGSGVPTIRMSVGRGSDASDLTTD